MNAVLMIGRISLVLVLALLAAAAIRRQSAALRHWVLAVGVAVAGALPIAAPLIPAWHVGLGPAPQAMAPPARTAGVQTSVVFEQARGAQPRAQARTESGASTIGRSWLALGARVWIAGSTISLAILLVGLARLKWLTRESRTIASGPWVTTADELRGALHIHRRVSLVQTDHPTLLATWGWRTPTIAIPAAADGWPLERIRLVLAHELAHVRRNDWLIQLGGELLRAVHWFNPFAWMAVARMRRESEYACDDVVLAAGADGRRYASQLVELARTLSRTRHPWLPVPTMARQSSLEGRVTAMLNPLLNRTAPTRGARLMATLALVGAAIPIAAMSLQGPFSTVSGTVADQTDRAIPNVAVVLTAPATREKHEVRTDRAGQYRMAGVAAGHYVLTINEPGFAPVSEPLDVASSDLQKNFQLHVGRLQESITVRDNTPLAPMTAEQEARRRASVDKYRQSAAACKDGAPNDTGGNILAPRKLVDVKPIYPDALRQANIGGTVTMEAVIGADGAVRDVRTVSSPDPGLAEAAAAAVRQWEFSPTLLNCTPIEVTMDVTTSFVPRP